MSENTPLAAIDAIINKAQQAFNVYKQYPIGQRVAFMRNVARSINELGDELISAAQEETHLPEARLIGEKGRTIFQWNSYADALEKA